MAPSPLVPVRRRMGLANGSRTFQLQATDQAGNVGPVISNTWTVDTRPPTIILTSPANGDARAQNEPMPYCRKPPPRSAERYRVRVAPTWRIKRQVSKLSNIRRARTRGFSLPVRRYEAVRVPAPVLAGMQFPFVLSLDRWLGAALVNRSLRS